MITKKEGRSPRLPGFTLYRNQVNKVSVPRFSPQVHGFKTDSIPW